MSIYVDLHVLQSLPPSCVNRDGAGRPKTAVYGGTVRARVSSQAWKHAMREKFKNLFSEDELGSRTKLPIKMVVKEMLVMNSSIDEEKAKKKAKDALTTAGIDFTKDDNAKALFFISNKQAKAIAKYALEHLESKETKDDKDALKKAIKENPSVDIALFGRMVAKDPTLNYDAAAQVAHAISTHEVQNEFDFYTAVDDLKTDDSSGAGYLDNVEFNSSTLYRYANANVSELVTTLGNKDVASIVKKFAEAFIFSMPKGMQNSFANNTFPDAVYVTIRSDQPVNLCGAFEIPIRKSDEGFAVASEKRLAEYAERVYTKFAAKPDVELCVGDYFGESVKSLLLPELLSELEKDVESKINEE